MSGEFDFDELCGYSEDDDGRQLQEEDRDFCHEMEGKKEYIKYLEETVGKQTNKKLSKQIWVYLPVGD